MTDIPPAPEPSQPVPPVAPPAYGETTTPAPGYAPPAQVPYGQAYAPDYVAPPRTNTLALVSLILSIAGLFVPGASIAAIITGHISLGQIKRTGEGGHGLGLAGTIIGYVVTGIGLLVAIGYAIFFVVLIGAGVAGSGSGTDF
jgi:Domain of unknown function (DUF4190)